MKEINYTIQDPLGIHARPAGILVKTLKNYKPKNAAGLESQTGQRFYSVLFPA